MELQEIIEFLKHKPGYLKEGAKRLRRKLQLQGFPTTTYNCREALRIVRRELKLNPVPFSNKEPKILFYDIETAYGLARVWRPGYKIRVTYDDFVKHPKIICISYKWNNSDEVHNFRWDSAQDDKAMLKSFIKELNKADFVVGHNGDNFDMPWIQTRALANKLDIYPYYSSVDTLKVARAKYRFPSNRLDDLGDYLGVGRKIKTDRSLWVDTVCNGDLKALDRMVRYCDGDVLLLEKIYNILSTGTLAPNHVGTLNNEIKATSPYTGSTNIEHVKMTTTAAGTIKHLMKCLDTGKYFKFSDRDYQKFLAINK